MKIKNLISLTVAAFFAACTSATSDTEVFTLNVSPNSNTPAGTFRLKSKSEEFVVLSSNGENILSGGRIVAVNDKQILLCDRHRFSLFQLPSGKAVSSFRRSGKSNKEYMGITDAFASLDDEEIVVLSNSSNNVIYYNLQGDHLKTIKNDSIVDFAMHDGKIYAFNDPVAKDQIHDFSIYDSDWNYISGVDFLSQWDDGEVEKSNFVNWYSAEIYNNTPLVYYDNVYNRITESGMIPYLYIDKGKLAIPSEIKNDLKREDERSRYIWGDWGVIAGDYFFYRYYYGKGIYSEIYSIKENKLLYRNFADSEDDNFGMPVTINDKEIYVWPQYADDNILYVLIPDYQMEELDLSSADIGVLKIEL